MGLSETISDSLSSFEKYNNKEVYNFGGFAVTGRLVSAFGGFIVIILMLMFSFSSAAISVMVSGLGGSTAYTADVIITENSGPSLSGSLDEDFIGPLYWGKISSRFHLTEVRNALYNSSISLLK